MLGFFRTRTARLFLCHASRGGFRTRGFDASFWRRGHWHKCLCQSRTNYEGSILLMQCDCPRNRAEEVLASSNYKWRGPHKVRRGDAKRSLQNVSCSKAQTLCFGHGRCSFGQNHFLALCYPAVQKQQSMRNLAVRFFCWGHDGGQVLTKSNHLLHK